MEIIFGYPGQANGAAQVGFDAYVRILNVRLTDTSPYANGNAQFRLNGGSWVDLTFNGSYWWVVGLEYELAGAGTYSLDIRDSADPTNIIQIADFEIQASPNGCETGWIEHNFEINSNDETIKYDLSFDSGPYSNSYYDVGAGFVEILPNPNTKVQVADYSSPSVGVTIRTTKASVNCDYPEATIYAATFFTPLSATYEKFNTSSEIVCDGSINLFPSGGTGSYSFAWNDGPTTQNRTGLCADTYTVTITDTVSLDTLELNISITTATGNVGTTNLLDPVNRWNFVRWYQLGDVSVANLSSIVYDVGNLYALPILAGDPFAFYINFDQLIDDADFGNWILGIFDCNFQETSTLDVLEQDIVTGSSYNVYASFTFPQLINNNYYYLVIYNSVSRDTKYISNPIEFKTSVSDTYQIEYSHSKNIYNFFYENVPTFTNKVRIHLEILRPQPKESAVGYELIDGTFKTARSTAGKTKEFVTGYFDEFAHDAFHAMIRHDNIIIDRKNWLRNENDEYNIEYTEDYPFAQGAVRLDDIAFAISNKMC